MTDFNITIEDATKLLHQKMKHELRLQQKKGKIPVDLSIENISLKDLFNLLETSIFDLILLLPIDILLSQDNIFKFVESTVYSLATKIKREELFLFSSKDFKKRIQPILTNIEKQNQDLNFVKN
ncbi:MAG: hypothetical protein N2321_03715 [Melioribacteraceae bacterium]|nr:hypothetical protein [Melioribacteraceae bacterium]